MKDIVPSLTEQVTYLSDLMKLFSDISSHFYQKYRCLRTLSDNILFPQRVMKLISVRE